MLNHFRTLLINESYTEPSEHIPFGYKTKKLPSDLQKIYDRLFAPSCSKYYKFYLAHVFENVIKSANMQDYVTAFDNRISYDLNDSSFFRIHRHSNPIISDTTFELAVLSNFTTTAYNAYYYDSFIIEQVGSTNNIRIYSKLKKKYLKGKEEYSDPEDSDCWILLDFTGTTCPPVYIGATGVSFTITNLSGGYFDDDADKTWEFLIEAPYTFDLLGVIKQFERSNPFKTLQSYKMELGDLENIWVSHFNPVYRFAALLIAYVTVVNKL